MVALGEGREEQAGGWGAILGGVTPPLTPIPRE